MSPAWPRAARESRRFRRSGRSPRWERSAFSRHRVELDIAAREIWPGCALALPQAAEAEGAAARASALADRIAATVRRRGGRRGRILCSRVGCRPGERPMQVRVPQAGRKYDAAMPPAAILDIDG